MMCGSLVLEGHVPDLVATIVTLILDAAAGIVAIVNMDDFTFAAGGEISVHGAPLNHIYDRALAQFDALLMPTIAKVYRYNPNKRRIDRRNVGRSDLADAAPFGSKEAR